MSQVSYNTNHFSIETATNRGMTSVHKGGPCCQAGKWSFEFIYLFIFNMPVVIIAYSHCRMIISNIWSIVTWLINKNISKITLFMLSKLHVCCGILAPVVRKASPVTARSIGFIEIIEAFPCSVLWFHKLLIIVLCETFQELVIINGIIHMFWPIKESIHVIKRQFHVREQHISCYDTQDWAP